MMHKRCNHNANSSCSLPECNGLDVPQQTSILPCLVRRELGLSSKFKCGKQKTDRVILESFAEDKASLPNKNKPCEISGQTRSTVLMEFSPDGKRIASTHGDHTIRVTDIRTGKCTHALNGHPRTPWCIAFHPSNSDLLGSGCLGGEVRIWDLQGGGTAVWRNQLNLSICSLTFHPTDTLIVVARSEKLFFWDWRKEEPFGISETEHSCEKIRWVKFNPNGKQLYTGISNTLPEPEAETREENSDPNGSFDNYVQSFADSIRMAPSETEPRENDRRRAWYARDREDPRTRRPRENSLNILTFLKATDGPLGGRTTRGGYLNTRPSTASYTPQAISSPSITPANATFTASPWPLSTHQLDLEPPPWSATLSSAATSSTARREQRPSSSSAFLRNPRSVSLLNEISEPDSLNEHRDVEDALDTADALDSLIEQREVEAGDALLSLAADGHRTSSRYMGRADQLLNRLLNGDDPPMPEAVVELGESSTESARSVDPAEDFANLPDLPEYESWRRITFGDQPSSFGREIGGVDDTGSNSWNSPARDNDFTSISQRSVEPEQSSELPEADVGDPINITDFISFLPEETLPNTAEHSYALPEATPSSAGVDIPQITVSDVSDGNRTVTTDGDVVIDIGRSELTETLDSNMLDSNLFPLWSDLSLPIPDVSVLDSVPQMPTDFSTDSEEHEEVSESNLAEPSTSPGQNSENGRTDNIWFNRSREASGSAASGRNVPSSTNRFSSRFRDRSSINRLEETRRMLLSASRRRDRRHRHLQLHRQQSQHTLPGSTANPPECRCEVCDGYELSSHYRLEGSSRPLPHSRRLLDHTAVRTSLRPLSFASAVDRHPRSEENSSANRSVDSLVDPDASWPPRAASPSNTTATTSLPPVNNARLSNARMSIVDRYRRYSQNLADRMSVEAHSSNLQQRVHQLDERVSAIQQRLRALQQDHEDESETLASLLNPSTTNWHMPSFLDLNPVRSRRRSIDFEARRRREAPSVPNPNVGSDPWLSGLYLPDPPVRRLEPPTSRQYRYVVMQPEVQVLDPILRRTDDRSRIVNRLRNFQDEVQTMRLETQRYSDRRVESIWDTQRQSDRRREAMWNYLVQEAPPYRSNFMGRPTPEPAPLPVFMEEEMRQQPSLNNVIYGAFMSNGGDSSIGNNLTDQTFRIQAWDFDNIDNVDMRLPNLHDRESNIVVPRAKIHNDSNVDISQDGQFLCAFVQNSRSFSGDITLGVFSLRPSSLGDCLYSKIFGPNAISVSISPLNRYILVGLASKRFAWVFTPKQMVAQVHLLKKPNAGEDSMEHVCDIMHPCDMDFRAPISMNSARWLRGSGEGLVYGTNRGDLNVYRPGFDQVEKPEHVDPSTESNPIRRSLIQVLGLSVPRTMSTSTQTSLNLRRSAGTQTDQGESSEPRNIGNSVSEPRNIGNSVSVPRNIGNSVSESLGRRPIINIIPPPPSSRS